MVLQGSPILGHDRPLSIDTVLCCNFLRVLQSLFWRMVLLQSSNAFFPLIGSKKFISIPIILYLITFSDAGMLSEHNFHEFFINMLSSHMFDMMKII